MEGTFMEREFYIEWLALKGNYSKSFYEKMCTEELVREYDDMVEDEREEI